MTRTMTALSTCSLSMWVLAGCAATASSTWPGHSFADLSSRGCSAIAVGDGVIWTAEQADEPRWFHSLAAFPPPRAFDIVRTDPRTGDTSIRFRLPAPAANVLPGEVTALAIGNDVIWVANRGKPPLFRTIHRASGDVASIALDLRARRGVRSARLPGGVAAGYGETWTVAQGRVFRLGTRGDTIQTAVLQKGQGFQTPQIAVTGASVWIRSAGAVHRLSREGAALSASVRMQDQGLSKLQFSGGAREALVADENDVWTTGVAQANRRSRPAVFRLAAATAEVVTTIDVSEHTWTMLLDLARIGDKIYVAGLSADNPTSLEGRYWLAAIDTSSHAVVERRPLGTGVGPLYLAAGQDGVWACKPDLPLRRIV